MSHEALTHPGEFDPQSKMAAKFAELSLLSSAHTEILQNGDSVVIGEHGLEVDGDDGLVTSAMIAVPMFGSLRSLKENDSDDVISGYLRVGWHKTKGWFIAGPESDTDQLDLDVRSKRNYSTVPIELGSENGKSVILGRNGIVFGGLDGDKSTIPPDNMSRSVREQLSGISTSREHLKIVIEEGVLKLTDISTYGTKVVMSKYDKK